MANETEYANITQVAAWVSANTAPHFRAASVMLPLITTETLRPGSKSFKFTQKGSLSMSVVAESSAASKSEYTETAVTLALQKGVVYWELTHEIEEYSDRAMLTELTQEAGQAAAEKFDTDALALLDGFSNSVGSTGVDLTPAVFKQAAYIARLNDNPASLTAVLHPTQTSDIEDDILTSTAVVYGNPELQQLLSQQRPMGGYRGTFLGVPIFETTNAEGINTNADWSGAIFSRYALAAIVGSGFKFTVSPNVPNSTREASLIMDYQVGEFVDVAGCGIVSDQ